jgi:hypothetical protein
MDSKRIHIDIHSLNKQIVSKRSEVEEIEKSNKETLKEIKEIEERARKEIEEKMKQMHERDKKHEEILNEIQEINIQVEQRQIEYSIALDKEDKETKKIRKPRINYDRKSDFELIPENTKFIAKRNGISIVGEKQNGKLVVNDKKYETVTSPLTEIFGKGCNGWINWEVNVEGIKFTMGEYVEFIKGNR